ncbi:hypothetical protein V1520DRAFT_280520 [Lipomyces starkeyi]
MRWRCSPLQDYGGLPILCAKFADSTSSQNFQNAARHPSIITVPAESRYIDTTAQRSIMTDNTIDSQKQLLISLLRSSSTVEQALETYDSRIKNKPLPLHPTQPPRTARNDGKEAKQGKQYPAIRVQDPRSSRYIIHRPKPLSSAEKKRKKLFDLRPEAANFRIYVELYKLWQSYAAELLGLTPTSTPPTTHGQLQTLASKLSSADFHGAYVVVDRSKCVSRVRLEGIILRDTRSAFVIVTKSNALRILPKEHTIFRIGVRKPGQPERFEEESDQMLRDREVEEVGDPKFELFNFLVYGSQLMYRPADRSGRKFKSKPTGDL